MLVRGGLVERVGTRDEIEPLIDGGCEVLDADGRVVAPGFVDAHAHPVFAGDRADEFEKRAAGVSYQEIAAAGGGIRSTVRRTRAATEDELFASALRRESWFLRTGTTTVEAKSGYGLSSEDEVKMLRVVRRLNLEGRLSYVPTFLGAHEVPDEYRGRARRLRRARRRRDASARRGRRARGVLRRVLRGARLHGRRVAARAGGGARAQPRAARPRRPAHARRRRAARGEPAARRPPTTSNTRTRRESRRSRRRACSPSCCPARSTRSARRATPRRAR